MRGDGGAGRVQHFQNAAFLAQRVVGESPIGDVFYGADHQVRLARRIPEELHAGAAPHAGAILAYVELLEHIGGALAGGHALHIFLRAAHVHGMSDVDDGEPPQLLERVAEHAQCSLIGIDEAVAHIHHGNADRRVVEHVTQPRLAGTQLLPLALECLIGRLQVALGR